MLDLLQGATRPFRVVRLPAQQHDQDGEPGGQRCNDVAGKMPADPKKPVQLLNLDRNLL
jgi:hypothetical protein